MTAETDALRLVPVEPTPEMLDAGLALLPRNMSVKGWPGLYQLYIAMTAAAPVSPDADLLEEAVGLVREYRDKTPLGHQPHMIAGRADAFLSKVEERGHDAPQNPATEGVGS